MTHCITLAADGNGGWAVSMDGVPQARDFPLRWVNQAEMPFAGVYIGDERQFDVEIWVDGTCRHRVPPEDQQTQRIYDLIEGNIPLLSGPFAPTDSHRERLQAEMRGHPGQEVHSHWTAVERMLGVHVRNNQELETLLGRVETDPELGIEMFQNTSPPVVREQIEALIDQRLHNYVASAISLVEHTRRILNKYEGTHFHRAYESRRTTISGAPVALFIKGLRNYSMHRSLPFVGNTVTIGRTADEIRAEIELSSASLLTWDKWPPAARNLIRQSGDTVKLRQVLSDHMALVRDLYTWVLAQRYALSRYEIALFDELVDEYNWMISRGEQGQPRRFGLRPDSGAATPANDG